MISRKSRERRRGRGGVAADDHNGSFRIYSANVFVSFTFISDEAWLMSARTTTKS